MQKNNIKSFICSFLFSILAVFAVQKVFLHADKTADIQEEPSKHIPHQKISLFAENAATKHQKPVLISSQITSSEVIGPISKTDLPVSVLAQNNNVDTDTTIQKPTEMPQNKPSTEPALTDLAYAQEITFSQSEQSELTEQKQLTDSGIVYADISDTIEQDSTNLADATLSEEIPLIEDNITVHKQINLQNTAQASQIAMIEPNTLINTIEEEDILKDETNLAEADIKKSELSQITSIPEVSEEIDESAWQTASAATENDEDLQNIETPSSIAEDSPWVLAKGNKYAKNQAAVEAYASLPVAPEEPQVQDLPQASETSDHLENPLESTTSVFNGEDSENIVSQTFSEPLLKEKENNSKLAYEMIQNILIPIPDSILNDADIVPDLSSSPDGVKERPHRIAKPKSNSDEKTDLDEKEKQSGLFKSISSWFKKNKEETPDNTSSSSKNKGSKEKSSILDKAKNKIQSALGDIDDYKNLNDVSIMPAELRLSFAPNRAEISGQTLRWIYAFADNARDHSDVYVEVRIDGTSSYALQQKRLNLLSSIFASRGLDYRKINTVFTSREPNSFIIRNIRFNNDSKGETYKE